MGAVVAAVAIPFVAIAGALMANGGGGRPAHAPGEQERRKAEERAQELRCQEDANRREREERERRWQREEQLRREQEERDREHRRRLEEEQRRFEAQARRQQEEHRRTMAALQESQRREAAQHDDLRRVAQAELRRLEGIAVADAERFRQQQDFVLAELERVRRTGEERERQLQERLMSHQAEQARVQQEAEQLRRAREEHQRQAAEVQRQIELEWPRPAVIQQGVVNIGVTGVSGSGKSTLVNWILGKRAGQPGAAPVGTTETTMAATPYTVESGPLAGLRIIDLPGAGTLNFPAVTYIRQMGLRYYSALIIVTAIRFTTTDMELYREAREWEIPCFLVRTKMDQDIAINKDDYNVPPAQTMDSIRDNIIEELQRGTPPGEETPDANRVFLLSGRPGSYEAVLRPEVGRFVQEMADDVARGLPVEVPDVNEVLPRT